jgi:integrase
MNSKVWIDKKGDTLRLRWNYEGKRVQLSLGIKDNLAGRAFAKQKIAEIEMDLISGHYDRTLIKYKPRKLGKNPTEISAVELFEKYAAAVTKDRELSHSSTIRFKGIASKLSYFLRDLPAQKVTESIAKNAIARWSETVNNRTIKERLCDLRACWDWAKGKYPVAESNPWAVCLELLKGRGNTPKPKQKRPFSTPEFQAIIAAFKASKHYSYYTDFVIFLSGTACRPGEAAGLRWQNIGADCSNAWIGESISRGHQNRKGTKTGKSRTIQLPLSVRSMLADRLDRLNPQPEDLVFLSPKGLPIDDHRFRARAWKTILESCNVEYRPPYNLRHSAISHALDRGVNPIALSEQTGHDKKTLLSTYAHAIDNDCVFVDFI